MKFAVACAMLAHQFQQYVATQWQVVSRSRNDRGSVTIEQVIWAVAVIAIVGIVVAAVKSYVTTQAGNIR